MYLLAFGISMYLLAFGISMYLLAFGVGMFSWGGLDLFLMVACLDA